MNLMDMVEGPLQICVARGIATLEEALDEALSALNAFVRRLKSTLLQL